MYLLSGHIFQMGYHVPTHVLSIPTPDCKREKINVLILLTSFPLPVLQPHMNTNLCILQPDSSEVDLGHMNHQGSEGFGCLSVFSCLVIIGVFKYPKMHHPLDKYGIHEKAYRENSV